MSYTEPITMPAADDVSSVQFSNVDERAAPGPFVRALPLERMADGGRRGGQGRPAERGSGQSMRSKHDGSGGRS